MFKNSKDWTISSKTFVLQIGQSEICPMVKKIRIYKQSTYRVRRQDRIQTLSYNGIDRIDRIDNNKGYTVENTVSCCKFCNIAKNNHSLEEFKEWIQKAHRWMFNDQSKDVGPSGSETGDSTI